MFDKKNAPPETLIYTGKYKNKTTITHLQYDTTSLRETKEISIHKKLNDWIMFEGLADVDRITKVCTRFGIDQLVIEDILNVHQRSKLEVYEDYLFDVNKFSYIRDGIIHHEYVSIILFEDKLLTFHEQNSPSFTAVANRIRDKKGAVRKKGHDYLYYILLDTLIDENITVRKYISEQIILLEEDIISLEQTNQTVLYNLRKELLYLKNSIRQLFSSFNTEEYRSVKLISPEIHKYFDDLKDHIVRLKENIESEQELLVNLLDVHINNVSNKMNTIMTILTIFSAIFIPLSFLAGVFGMNFINFPLLQNSNGMVYFLVICFGISGGMLGFFKYKKWI